MLYLGIALLVYGAFCIFAGLVKIPFIWNLGKIEMFKKLLGETGTQIFFVVWGLIALGFGIWITFFLV
jgi:fatty acid desaturase